MTPAETYEPTEAEVEAREEKFSALIRAYRARLCAEHGEVTLAAFTSLMEARGLAKSGD